MHAPDLLAHGLSFYGWLTAGFGVGALFGLIGARFSRRNGEAALEVMPPLTQTPAATNTSGQVSVTECRLSELYLEWLRQQSEATDLWPPFDQLVRESLAEQIGARRVRCFHVRPQSGILEPIGAAREAQSTGHPDVRVGLLGHVASTGREYVASEVAQDALLASLAAQTEETWDWICPIRDGEHTIGVIAVANIDHGVVLTRDVRVLLRRALTIFWSHVETLVRLRETDRVDKGTGVLARSHFFDAAAAALVDSYQGREPVVLMVLAIEGLRRLDDAGSWRVRDEIVEGCGREIIAHVRSDDIVGRFTDDRFIVLLRRLDTALGRLIAQKVLAATERSFSADQRLAARVGLVGTGFAQPPLDRLLETALSAIDRARHRGVPIETDLESAAAEGAAL